MTLDATPGKRTTENSVADASNTALMRVFPAGHQGSPEEGHGSRIRVPQPHERRHGSTAGNAQWRGLNIRRETRDAGHLLFCC